MSGHAAQVCSLKKILTANGLYKFNWVLSHVRNIYVVFVFFMSWQDGLIRKGFGDSAIGHCGYILVRAGPVFRFENCNYNCIYWYYYSFQF
jgi:hypothetical protein